MANPDYLQRIDYLIQMANCAVLGAGLLFGYLFGVLTYIASRSRR